MGMSDVAAPDWRKKVIDRYGFDPMEGDITGEDMLYKVADQSCQGSAEDAARKILQDFRQGRLGPICLQLAPKTEEDDGQVMVKLKGQKEVVNHSAIIEEKRMARAEAAIETAKERGLELPPVVEGQASDASSQKEDEVGKGLFDGW